MPQVATRRTAKLFLVDDSGTPKVHEVYPMEGDFSWTATANLIEALHRGEPIADGEGIMEGDKPLMECTYSYMAHDFTDAVKTDALHRWMEGDTTTTTAIASAGWTATTSRPDALKTLHVRYAPQGTGTGKPYYTVSDCVVSERTPSEGEPTVFSVTMKSTTASKAVMAYYP